MNIWHDIDPARITPDKFVAVIEIPKDGYVKYELDKETGFIRMDRVLHTATHYPANYGFIPKTYSADNDPLDVLVLCSSAVYPLTLIDVYPIGCIKMIDDNELDEKIIAIPFADPYYNVYNDISELPNHVSQEMKHFFTVYKALEGKKTAVLTIYGKDYARECIARAIADYKTKIGD